MLGGEVVAEETEGNIIRLIRGTELLASDADHARTYYHYASDELGSVTHVVTGQGKEPAGGGENPEGSVLNRYGYDAWGNLALCEETVPNRFLYTGQQYDPVTQQYYLRARYYNPVIARFTQEDTYRGDGLNLYTYCRNNPVCHVDPSGHCGKDPNGDFMPPAVVPEGKQLPAVYVPQQEALRRWCANFQDDAGTAGRAGTGGNGDFMPPAVIPRQPLPSLDPKRPSLVPEPPRQLPAVIYPLPQDLLGGNPQNRVGGPVADVPNSGNRVSGSGGDAVYIPRDDSGNVIPLRKQRINGQDIPLPDPAAEGRPHTVLGGKVSSETGEVYRQSATFTVGSWPTANGYEVPISEVHWTDHNRPDVHTNPHQHVFIYDFEEKYWKRGDPERF